MPGKTIYSKRELEIKIMITEPQITPWNEVTRYRSKNLMDPNNTSESLEQVTNGEILYTSSHLSSGGNSHPWQGWSEEDHLNHPEEGGAVRTPLLSGSYGQLKKLRVDSEVNSETVTTSWSASIGENLKVGNAVGIAGYLQIGGNTASLQPGASAQASAITPKQGADSGVSNLRLIVSGNELTKGNSYTTGDASVSGALYVSKSATIGGDENLAGDLYAGKNAVITQSLFVNGDSHLSGNLTVYKSESIKGDLTVDKDLEVKGTASIDKTLLVSGKTTIEDDLLVNGNSKITGALEVNRGITGSKEIQVLGTGSSLFNGSVIIQKDLVVHGTTTTLDTEELKVKDKSITIAMSASTPAQADGAGIDIAGADVHFHYTASNNSMGLNKGLYVSGSSGVIGDLTVSGKVSASSAVVTNFQATNITASNVSASNVTASNVSSSKILATSVTASTLQTTSTASLKHVETDNVEVANQTTTKYGTIQGAAGQNALTIQNGNVSAANSDFTVKDMTGSNISMSGVISASYFVGDGSQITGVTASVVSASAYTENFNATSGTTVYRIKHNMDSVNLVVAFYQNATAADGQTRPIQIIPEQLAIVDESNIDVVFGRPVEGYVVITKAGHVLNPWDIYDPQEFVDSRTIHYGTNGIWSAKIFNSTTASAEIVVAQNYIDTPKIGNLNTTESYQGRAWGSYTTFDDHQVSTYVRPSEAQEPVVMTQVRSNGDFYVRGAIHTSESFNASDRNLKENIQPLENALEAVKNIPGVRFNWKNTGVPGIGTIAQDVQAIYPELTNTVENLDGEEHLEVNYNGLVGVLLAAVRELSEKVEQLENKLTNNENR